MSNKVQSEQIKSRRLKFIRYITSSRTDTEIFEEIGIQKRAVGKFANTLTRKGVIVHSEPNERFGRHYWLAMALEDAVRIIDLPTESTHQVESYHPPLPRRPWYIISDNPACMPRDPS